jgi:cytochrome b pre-mRNA-processing protein 3
MDDGRKQERSLVLVSLLKRLFGKPVDDRAVVQPLWRRVIEVARQPRWYADYGIADTMPGRFDAVTLVLALVLLRMEREPDLMAPAARLTELFVADMDGQMRQSGVGDLVVGKHIGKQMQVLGGRLGALRDALPNGEQAVAAVIERNVTLVEGTDILPITRAAIALMAELDAIDQPALLAGAFAR